VDRLIAATAAMRVPLLTQDSAIERAGVTVIWW
jgi:hypothetical protein